MTLRDRLLKIDAQCFGAHALLNQIATRDHESYPLPEHLESKLSSAIADLTAARDALNDWAEADSNSNN